MDCQDETIRQRASLLLRLADPRIVHRDKRGSVRLPEAVPWRELLSAFAYIITIIITITAKSVCPPEFTRSPRTQSRKPALPLDAYNGAPRGRVIQRPGERRGDCMIGDKIGETKGKRLVRRVISTDPPTAEVSFEDAGTMFGVATSGMGTYTSIIRPDGSIHGEGKGLIMTPDGEVVTWTGAGLGKFGKAGAVSYRGMLFFRTASENHARLNHTCGAFEYAVDSAGSTISKVWEWK
jgi:hypothetical protein